MIMQDNQRSTPPVEDMQAGQINLSGRVAMITGGGCGISTTVSLVLAQTGRMLLSYTIPVSTNLRE